MLDNRRWLARDLPLWDNNSPNTLNRKWDNHQLHMVHRKQEILKPPTLNRKQGNNPHMLNRKWDLPAPKNTDPLATRSTDPQASKSIEVASSNPTKLTMEEPLTLAKRSTTDQFPPPPSKTIELSQLTTSPQQDMSLSRESRTGLSNRGPLTKVTRARANTPENIKVPTTRGDIHHSERTLL